MATLASNRRKFWRTDWFVGVLVVLVVLVLHSATDFFGTLERRYYNFASTSTSRQPSDRIAIIAIDEQSIANIGRWPRSRDVHAQLIDQLAAAKAKVALDADAKLAVSMAKAGNVLVPSIFAAAVATADTDLKRNYSARCMEPAFLAPSPSGRGLG